MRDSAGGGALTEVTFYILLALRTPRHGYAVMQFIEQRTGGRLKLGAGTLYGALNSLAERGWIAPVPGGESGRRRAYVLTDTGERAAAAELNRLRGLVNAAEEILEAEHDG